MTTWVHLMILSVDQIITWNTWLIPNHWRNVKIRHLCSAPGTGGRIASASQEVQAQGMQSRWNISTFCVKSQCFLIGIKLIWKLCSYSSSLWLLLTMRRFFTINIARYVLLKASGANWCPNWQPMQPGSGETRPQIIGLWSPDRWTQKSVWPQIFPSCREHKFATSASGSFSSPPKLLQAEVVRSTVDQQREFSAGQAQLIQQQIHRQSNVPQLHQVVHHLSYWEASKKVVLGIIVPNIGWE